MRRDLAIALLLAATTLVVYAPVLHHDFISYDDPDYVTSNPHVRAGLTGDGLAWAFTTWHTGNWHPLTWLSHMLDVTLFGLDPGRHHGTSVFLHALNAVLLFAFLRRATGDRAAGAAVAGLFALHPLHVESVAWIAERKDVLSATFGLLALWAWAIHLSGESHPATGAGTVSGLAKDGRSRSATTPIAGSGSRSRRDTTLRADQRARIQERDSLEQDTERSPRAGAPIGRAYVASVALFALGLLAKPMLVTLPLVLLLLDVWPFRRIRLPARGNAGPTPWAHVLSEKAPFFALAAASCVVTLFAQRSGGAVSSLARWPVGIRIENALVSYVRYLMKTFWPSDLAIFYPMPGAVPLAAGLGSAVLLIVASAIAVRILRRRPYVAAGWFWFAGMLVPVIGLVKVGGQSMADRYTYLPLVGIFVVAAFSLKDALGPLRSGRAAFAGISAGVCVALAFGTRAQLTFWKDSKTLYTRALSVTTDNGLAHYNLGCVLSSEGRETEASAHFTEAIRIDASDSRSHANLGVSLFRLGRTDESLRELSEAVRLDPTDGFAVTDFGAALFRAGRVDEALVQQALAVRLHPDLVEARVNLGVVYNELGRFDEALREYERAVTLDPNSADAQVSFGSALANLGRAREALPHLAAAAQLRPQSAITRANLGNVLMMLKRPDEAVPEYREALRIEPGDPVVEQNLQRALASAPAAR